MSNEQTPAGGNPYSSPFATLDKDPVHADGTLVPEGKSIDVGRAVSWFGRGFELFKRSPGIWVVSVIILFLIMVVIGLVPFLGNLATSLLYPVFGGGLMIGCHAVANDEDLEIEHLFAGFKDKFGPLLMVGVFYLIGMIGIVVVAGILGVAVVGSAGMGALLGGNQAGAVFGAGLGFGLLLVVLVAVALSIPLAMALWFAPALVVFHGLTPVEAMKSSFRGCLKNIVPFLVYGIVYFVLAIVASIPLFLGWLVLVPVVIASIYAGYRDIYLA